MKERIRFQLGEIAASYRWLWRACRDSSASPLRGTIRFLWSVAQDTVGLTAWTAGVPIRHGVQRDRAVIPALLVATVMLASLRAVALEPTRLPGPATFSAEVSEACGAVYLGAIAAPGDDLVRFESCIGAVSEASVCPECGLLEVAPYTVAARFEFDS